MKKLIVWTTILSGLISCNSGIDGEGVATSSRDFVSEGFQEVKIVCNCDVTLIPSEATKVVVESHQNLIENLNITSKRSRLEITEKSKVGKYSLYNVNVYFNPKLNSVKISDKTKLKVSGTLKAPKMKFELEDKSTIFDTYVEIEKLELSMTGKTSAKLIGTAVDLNVTTEDNASAELDGLQVVDLTFRASDNSSLIGNPMKNLSGKASDNAVVKYLGDPNKDATSKDKAIIEKK